MRMDALTQVLNSKEKDWQHNFAAFPSEFSLPRKFRDEISGFV